MSNNIPVLFSNFFNDLSYKSNSKSIFDQMRDFCESVDVPSYPPYNISYNKKTGEISVEVAVAGFYRDELKITVENEKVLHISGKKKSDKDNPDVEYFYRKFAKRSFINTIRFPNRLKVTSTSLSEGVLTVVVSFEEDKDSIETIEIN